MSSSTMIDNRKKDILILGKGATQGLEHEVLDTTDLRCEYFHNHQFFKS